MKIIFSKSLMSVIVECVVSKESLLFILAQFLPYVNDLFIHDCLT